MSRTKNDIIFETIVKILRKLKISSTGVQKTIYFGIADTKEEFNDVYRLRYQVYVKHGYIDASKYENNLEIDSNDTLGLCKYFIAIIDNKMIGCIRLIVSDPLPTETYFDYCEPSEIKSVPRNERCELGRFIIIPPNREKGEYLPRGLVMLFLIDILSAYGLQNKLFGGYSFIKKSLEIKMDKMKMPIRRIADFKEKYPTNGDLYRYFSQPDDVVVPVYFLTKEFYEFSQRHIHNSLMFKNEGENCLILRENLYTKFLHSLKIL